MKIKRYIFLVAALLLMGQGASAWSGSGNSASDPILIANANDWNTLATNVASGTNYSGKYFKLTANITVTTMVNGTFSGTFDGAGYTLTFTYTSTANNAAPFAHLNGGTIKNLRTAGTITAKHKFAAGIVAQTDGGTNNITNCWSSVTIDSSVSGDGTHGGLVGHNPTGTLNITNCLFDGKLLGANTQACGGIVGYRTGGSSVYIKNSLFAPAEVTIKTSGTTSGCAMFTRNGCDASTSYYKTTWAPDVTQGNNANSMTAEALVTALNNGNKNWCIHRGNAIPIMVNLVISTKAQWDTFAANNNDYIGKYVQLGANIGTANTPVTAMKSGEFKGVFDGNGHTLTVNLTNSGGNVAPFYYLYGGTIMNLTVSGDVTTAGSFNAGLVARTHGGINYIQNCIIHTNVAVKDYGGGVVGHADDASSLTISDCIYDGTITHTGSYAGGFIGWYNNNQTLDLIMNNCLFKGTYSGSDKFHPIGVKLLEGVLKSSSITNCFYTTNPTASGNRVIANGGIKCCKLTIGTDGVSIASGSTCTFQGTTYHYGAITLAYDHADATVVYTVGGTTISGNSFTINTGAAFTSGAATITADVSYNITYNLNGGSLDAPQQTYSNPTTYKPTDAAITLRNPHKDGYAFYGWTGTGLTTDTGADNRSKNVNVTIVSGSHGARTYTADFREYTEGPWHFEAIQTGTCNTNQEPTHSFNGLYLNTIWMNPYPWQDNDGFGFTQKGTSGASGKKYGLYSIFASNQQIPSYTRKVLHWDYQIATHAVGHQQTVALYVHDDSTALKAMNVDFTANYANGTGSANCIDHYVHAGNTSSTATSKTTDLEFDNRNGSSDQTISKYLMLTQVIESTGVVDMHHWGGFKNLDMTWDTYYYKTVTFDANGGTGTAMAQLDVENSGTLPANTYTRTGYTFAGWSTSANGNVEYADQAAINATSTSKGPVTLYANWTENVATLNETANALDELTAMSGKQTKVTFTRSGLTANSYSTMCLPFDFTAPSGCTFYAFTGVEWSTTNDQWEATITEQASATTLSAHTPYIFKCTGTSATFTNNAVIAASSYNNALVEVGATSGTDQAWKFKGTYTPLSWASADPTEPTYGFSTYVPNETIAAGTFVRFVKGASLAPFRARLIYSGTDTHLNAPRRAGANELPVIIIVRIIGINGETTSIGTLDTRTGEVTTDGWYTLGGMKLKGQPNQQGIYIHNGRKEVIR